jgi:hypothetical protein
MSCSWISRRPDARNNCYGEGQQKYNQLNHQLNNRPNELGCFSHVHRPIEIILVKKHYVENTSLYTLTTAGRELEKHRSDNNPSSSFSDMLGSVELGATLLHQYSLPLFASPLLSVVHSFSP